MTNPLLDFSDLPRFDQIRPEHVAPAMDDLLASAESALATVTAPDFPAKWTSIATVLDVATERLGCAVFRDQVERAQAALPGIPVLLLAEVPITN